MWFSAAGRPGGPGVPRTPDAPAAGTGRSFVSSGRYEPRWMISRYCPGARDVLVRAGGTRLRPGAPAPHGTPAPGKTRQTGLRGKAGSAGSRPGHPRDTRAPARPPQQAHHPRTPPGTGRGSPAGSVQARHHRQSRPPAPAPPSPPGRISHQGVIATGTDGTSRREACAGRPPGCRDPRTAETNPGKTGIHSRHAGNPGYFGTRPRDYKVFAIMDIDGSGVRSSAGNAVVAARRLHTGLTLDTHFTQTVDNCMMTASR